MCKSGYFSHDSYAATFVHIWITVIDIEIRYLNILVFTQILRLITHNLFL